MGFIDRFKINPYGAAIGMNYCGPGTQLVGQKALNATDKVCKSHDFDYNRVNKMAALGRSKEEQRQAVRKADKAMLQRLEKDVPLKEKFSLGYAVSKGGIWLKNKLEDIGVLDPLKFAGGKNKTYDTKLSSKEEAGDYKTVLPGYKQGGVIITTPVIAPVQQLNRPVGMLSFCKGGVVCRKCKPKTKRTRLVKRRK
jgi:hypothetical protein